VFFLRVLYSPVFEKDAARVDASFRKELKRAVDKIIANPEGGKPLKHLKNFFSERVRNFRVVYRLRDGDLQLLCFKNRDEVYDFLKQIRWSV
jgi:mRNA-degrading endonuclease RelE of RelBE toxin-antitoxin system